MGCQVLAPRLFSLEQAPGSLVRSLVIGQYPPGGPSCFFQLWRLGDGSIFLVALLLRLITIRYTLWIMRTDVKTVTQTPAKYYL
jgi:hypothetical protein